MQEHLKLYDIILYTMQTLEVEGATTSSTWFWTDMLCYSLNSNVGTSLLQIKKNMLCYGSYLLSYSGPATIETSGIFSLLYGTMSCCKQGGNGPGSWTDLISHLDFCLVAINTAPTVFLWTTILHEVQCPRYRQCKSLNINCQRTSIFYLYAGWYIIAHLNALHMGNQSQRLHVYRLDYCLYTQ